MEIQRLARFWSSKLLLCSCFATPALGYLGDFESDDGYLGAFSDTIVAQTLGSDWQDGSSYVPHTLGLLLGTPDLYERSGPDVSRYNAGAYGTGGGGAGGTAADIVDNSGQWTANAGGRLTVDTSGGLSLWNFVAVQGGGAFSGSGYLTLRAIDADLNYNYSVDSRDLGGVGPGSVSDGEYSMGFWFCPGEVPGGTTDNIFGLSYLDVVGTAGLAFGYDGLGAIQYDLGGTGIWNTSGVTVGTTGWSYADIVFDTSTDTASMSISAWNDLAGALNGAVSVFSNEDLGVDMGALKILNWQLDGGMDKNFFDNVTMSVTPVPEPGAGLLVLMTGLLLTLTRRRSGRA